MAQGRGRSLQGGVIPAPGHPTLGQCQDQSRDEELRKLLFPLLDPKMREVGDVPETATDVPSKLPESLPDCQDHRRRRCSHTELELFLKAPQDGGIEGDVNRLDPTCCNDALLGGKLEAAAHGCG